MHADDSLMINEIFYSIQGESTRAGHRCVFVRLTGCNLRCRWCDTQYAFHQGERISIAEVVNRALSYQCDLVEITGGEPLLQNAVHALIRALLDANKTVMIETSGAADISCLDPRVIRIMDLKCPASGEAHRNLWSNLTHLTPRDELKFVVASRADYEWARQTIVERDLTKSVGAVLMSCAFGQLDSCLLAKWILDDNLPVRLQLQLHKHIWGPDARGV